MYNTYMKTVCLSENANRILKDFLMRKGYGLVEIRRTGKVYDAVSSHGDIYLCKIRNELVAAPVQLPFLLEGLLLSRTEFTRGASDPGYRYPANVRYNAAQIGGYLVHNTKHTDPVILSRAKDLDLKLIHVKQGYTKCNLVVVDENSAITSDAGLASALTKHGIDILLISQGHVRLSGFPYGFLGGASGRVDGEIIFNGNLSAHPDQEEIKEFISRKGLMTVWFEEYPLEDIGSILQL